MHIQTRVNTEEFLLFGQTCIFSWMPIYNYQKTLANVDSWKSLSIGILKALALLSLSCQCWCWKIWNHFDSCFLVFDFHPSKIVSSVFLKFPLLYNWDWSIFSHGTGHQVQTFNMETHILQFGDVLLNDFIDFFSAFWSLFLELLLMQLGTFGWSSNSTFVSCFPILCFYSFWDSLNFVFYFLFLILYFLISIKNLPLLIS